jgi:hypothetical protein
VDQIHGVRRNPSIAADARGRCSQDHPPESSAEDSQIVAHPYGGTCTLAPPSKRSSPSSESSFGSGGTHFMLISMFTLASTHGTHMRSGVPDIWAKVKGSMRFIFAWTRSDVQVRVFITQMVLLYLCKEIDRLAIWGSTFLLPWPEDHHDARRPSFQPFMCGGELRRDPDKITQGRRDNTTRTLYKNDGIEECRRLKRVNSEPLAHYQAQHRGHHHEASRSACRHSCRDTRGGAAVARCPRKPNEARHRSRP